MKRRSLLSILLTMLLTQAAMLAYAATYTVDDVPNVHRLDKHRFVSDPDNYLSPETRNAVDRRLYMLMDSTTAEVAYVIVGSIGDDNIENFSQNLATKWGIGKKDNNNGMLVLIVMDQRKIRIHTGYGIEGVIPDITAGHIMDRDMIPYMRDGNIDGAVDASSKRIFDILTGKETAAEIESQLRNNEDLEIENMIYTLLMIVAFCSLCFAIMVLVNKLIKCRKLSNHQKVDTINQSLWLMIVLTFTSALMALPLLLIMLMLRYWYRHSPVYCDTCGTKMHRLNEEEDNRYLSAAQDREEELKSVDYDVWLCDKCGTTEIFPYYSRHTKYKECPRCHTRTAWMYQDDIIKKPTTQHRGTGVHKYVCKYCGHQYDEHYTIPKLEVAAGAAAAGAGLLSGGGRSGGFGGGSFGGGSFGGGGATRGW